MTDSNNALVGHLFRRAGFGLRTIDRNRFPIDDYAATVETLLTPTVAKRDDTAVAVASATDDVAVLDIALRDAQTNWLHSMVSTRAPLVERMTLFFANHFATAYTPSLRVDAAALVAQHGKIRQHALGNFAALAHAMLDDLAFACYLNNDRNYIRRPNENLARELMELFVLGTANYTERDVKEVARSLTGYRITYAAGVHPRLVYYKDKHDDGFKTVLGKTAKFTPHEVLDHLLAQPAAKRFIATKLVTTFVSPTPDPTLVGTVARVLHGWDIRAALRTIFLSTQFRAAASHHVLPKTPAEHVVTIMRGLRRLEYNEGLNHMAAAGQTLYRPPSVAGWPTGKRMLGPGAMLARYNAASRFVHQHVKDPAPGLPKGGDVTRWMQEFGMTALSPSTADAIETYKREAGRQTTAAQTAGVLTLLLASPDFQLS